MLLTQPDSSLLQVRQQALVSTSCADKKPDHAHQCDEDYASGYADSNPHSRRDGGGTAPLSGHQSVPHWRANTSWSALAVSVVPKSLSRSCTVSGLHNPRVDGGLLVSLSARLPVSDSSTWQSRDTVSGEFHDAKATMGEETKTATEQS